MSQGTFVITGASRGLGREVAKQAFERGFSVALIARTEGDLKKAEAEITNTSAKRDQMVSTHKCDLAKTDQVQKVFQDISKIHKNIRGLVNNAGTWTGGKRLEQLTREDIQASLDLNFFSAFNAAKAVLDLHKKGKGKDLSIVNIGATSSLQGWEDVSAFCLAKGALRSFSQSLAREMGPSGIHVAHLIIDGLIDNDRTKKLNSKLKSDKFINMKSIADSILHVALQERSCWTFEWDVRPFNESW